MARPTKKQQVANLPQIIKETAWGQITKSGASSLSLRGIARALGITAPAIYNYFPDRDALVTSLIIDAFSSFGDWQLAARDALAGAGREFERLRATGIAYRQWALEHPHHYLLIFGNPVTGYIPPIEKLRPVMMRSISALTSCIAELHALGRIDMTGIPRPQLPPGYCFCNTPETGDGDMLDVHAVALLFWSRVHGLVSLELTGKLPPFERDGAALYEFEIDSIARQFVRPT